MTTWKAVAVWFLCCCFALSLIVRVVDSRPNEDTVVATASRNSSRSRNSRSISAKKRNGLGVDAVVWTKSPSKTRTTNSRRSSRNDNNKEKEHYHHHEEALQQQEHPTEYQEHFEGFGETTTTTQCDNAKRKKLVVTIVTDLFPGETSFFFSNAEKERLVSVGGFAQPGYQYVHVYHVCPLENDDVTFHIQDPNGICCLHGKGSYQVEYEGRIVARGGAFQGGQETAVVASSSSSSIMATSRKLTKKTTSTPTPPKQQTALRRHRNDWAKDISPISLWQRFWSSGAK